MIINDNDEWKSWNLLIETAEQKSTYNDETGQYKVDVHTNLKDRG